METTQIKAERRPHVGTRHARAARNAGRLPAVIYGHGAEPEAISLAAHDVEVALLHGARMLDVEIAGQVAPYLIKEVQYDHLASTPIHLDLVRVNLDEKVQVIVGIELKGTPAGAQEGGIVEQMMADMEVECIITAIPDTLHPSIAHLKVGDSLLVKDIELPPGVVALSDPEDRIATVRLPAAVKDEEAETPEEEGEEKAAEPERIGRERKEEDEES
jgi:large subunit ribosomal protein L25